MNMKTIVLRFGLASGAVLSVMTALMIPMCMNQTFDNQEIVGYTSMVLAFLLVFFGIRSYRNGAGGGTITFGKAFQVGILITLVTCAVYVVAWEIVYWGFIPDFAETYSRHVLDKLRESGATADAIAAKQAQMEQFQVWYKNPLFNVAMTFMEIFPVGLIVTLVSAAILRRRGPGGRPAVSTASA
jgi:uncharacterized protein DUF4199